MSVLRVELKRFFFQRFGLINGVQAKKDIRKGEEILMEYIYPQDRGPLWFTDLKNKLVADFEESFGPT